MGVYSVSYILLPLRIKINFSKPYVLSQLYLLDLINYNRENPKENVCIDRLDYEKKEITRWYHVILFGNIFVMMIHPFVNEYAYDGVEHYVSYYTRNKHIKLEWSDKMVNMERLLSALQALEK